MSYWVGTLSGKKIDLENPDPEQIDLNDIATALSRINRFNGHTTQSWSVLQHSVCVTHMVAEPYKLAAILHDATEAYICDIPSPLKWFLGDSYRQVETRLADAIGRRFDVDLINLPHAVKVADSIMLMTEHERFQPDSLNWEADYSDGVRAPQSIFTQSNNIRDFTNYVSALVDKNYNINGILK